MVVGVMNEVIILAKIPKYLPTMCYLYKGDKVAFEFALDYSLKSKMSFKIKGRDLIFRTNEKINSP